VLGVVARLVSWPGEEQNGDALQLRRLLFAGPSRLGGLGNGNVDHRVGMRITIVTGSFAPDVKRVRHAVLRVAVAGPGWSVVGDELIRAYSAVPSGDLRLHRGPRRPEVLSRPGQVEAAASAGGAGEPVAQGVANASPGAAR
jgi:hypothetical protein